MPSEPFRPRVLLLAESANPEWVSVPLVGWSLAEALSRVADTHLVTQVRNREALLRAGLVEGRDFTALDTEAVARPLWRAGERLRGAPGAGWTALTALSAVAEHAFEEAAWRAFRPRLRGGEFHLVHRITPVSPTVPSPMAARCRAAGVPFVLGPLNGGVAWPAGFDDVRRSEHEWLSYVRGLHRLLPGYRSTREQAAAILVGSRDTWAQMPARLRPKCFFLPENAVDPARFAVRRPPGGAGPLRVVFVGRLTPYKGADMLLEAAAPLIREGRVRVEIVGDGPQRPEIEALVAGEGLGGGVTLAGWMPHGQVPQRLAAADVFAFPSIREFGGGAVLEAMAVGLPAMVVDYGGPADVVTPGTGWLIPPGRRDELVARFGAGLARLAGARDEVEARGRAARARVREHFTWEAKAGRVMLVYRWVLGRASVRPTFSMPEPDAPAARAG